MVDDTKSPFSAAPSALGYLYQFRYALLATLRRLRDDTAFQIAIETLDDVVFESGGRPAQILQTKHHNSRAASLADASPDLWKTLRIWTGLLLGGFTLTDTSLLLVTTSAATTGQAASYLRATGRDVSKAVQRLRFTAQTSQSKDNAPAYDAFRSLNEDQQEQLIGAIVVVDNAPDILTAQAELHRELRWSADPEFVGALLERLEGWWFGRTIRAMTNAVPSPIPSSEVDDTVNDLREQFKTESLPIDEDLLAVEVDAALYSDHVFVHQLRLFDASTRRIMTAARDYFRAFEQRSRWVREDLLLVGELDRYERRLTEEWEVHFNAIAEELGEDASQAAMKKAAVAVYNWVETQAAFPIRMGCTEPFVTRGSYQILSDRRRVGWHPEFGSRLRALLDGNAAQ